MRSYSYNTGCCSLTAATRALRRVIQTSPISAVMAALRHGPPIHRLPDELLVECWSYAPILMLPWTLQVCKRWHALLTRSFTLWAQLDLRAVMSRLLAVLPILFCRSASAPLSLNISIDSPQSYKRRAGDSTALAALLAPEVNRMQHLALGAAYYLDLSPLYQIFAGPAPMLETLDIAQTWGYRTSRIPSDILRGGAISLRSLSCGSDELPTACPAFYFVTSLRLSCQNSAISRIFVLFPRITSLVVDAFDPSTGFPCVPHLHPLRSAALHVSKPDSPGTGLVTWKRMDELGFARLPSLTLTRAPIDILLSLARDSSWKPRTLVIGYDEEASAVFEDAQPHHVRSRRIACANEMATSMPLHRLMYDKLLSRHLTALTLSAWLSPLTAPFSDAFWRSALSRLVIPPLTLPYLATLTLSCGIPTTYQLRDSVTRRDSIAYRPASLFEDDVRKQCGRLRAPRLHTLRLARGGPVNTPDAARCEVLLLEAVCPAALARFISGHILKDAACLPELVVDDFDGVRLLDDPAGKAALYAVVAAVKYKT